VFPTRGRILRYEPICSKDKNMGRLIAICMYFGKGGGPVHGNPCHTLSGGTHCLASKKQPQDGGVLKENRKSVKVVWGSRVVKCGGKGAYRGLKGYRGVRIQTPGWIL